MCEPIPPRKVVEHVFLLAVHVFLRAEKKLLVSYRGTAQLRDLIPDFQLATNRKNIPRLNEAREFAKRVREKTKDIPEENVRFYGHSLGGFLVRAEKEFCFVAFETVFGQKKKG
jgi:hypothetical protein